MKREVSEKKKKNACEERKKKYAIPIPLKIKVKEPPSIFDYYHIFTEG